MKRRPHKIVSVVLLVVLIAGMGMACRIQSLESRNKRWTENTETAGKILTESGKKEAQKQTNGTENDDAAQNAKRVFGDEPAELYARSAVLMDAEDEGGVHSTTAEDLAKIMRYCIMTSGEKETFLEVTRTKEYQFQDADRKRTFSCHNHNAFLDMMDGALSGKTGFTAEAGYCYVGSLRRDERTFIVALLACGWPDNKGYKWKDTRRLMEYGLEHYQYRDIDKKMQIPEIKVAGGVDDKKPYQYCLNVPVKIERPAEENSKILMRDGEELRAKLELAKYWNAPLKKGEKIGMLTYYLDGYKVAEYELKNEKAVAKRDFSWCIFWIIKSVML